LLMFFRFLHLRGWFWNFPLFISSNDVCWGRNWGWRVVLDVDVQDELIPCWIILLYLFCNSSYHFLELMFEFLMNDFSCFYYVNPRNDDSVVFEWRNGFFRYSWFVTSVNVFAVFVTLFDVYLYFCDDFLSKRSWHIKVVMLCFVCLHVLEVDF